MATLPSIVRVHKGAECGNFIFKDRGLIHPGKEEEKAEPQDNNQKGGLETGWQSCISDSFASV